MICNFSPPPFLDNKLSSWNIGDMKKVTILLYRLLWPKSTGQVFLRQLLANTSQIFFRSCQEARWLYDELEHSEWCRRNILNTEKESCQAKTLHRTSIYWQRQTGGTHLLQATLRKVSVMLHIMTMYINWARWTLLDICEVACSRSDLLC